MPPQGSRYTRPSGPQGSNGGKIGLIIGVVLLIGMFAIGGLIGVVALINFEGFSSPFSGGSIAVIEIQGAIMDAELYRDQFDRLDKDDSIRAVVVRIDSPGGAVGTSQEIYYELNRLRAQGIAVVGAMGNTAASGGYYAALGCDEVFAYEGTVTGSIGVLMSLVNVEGLLEKIGADMEAVTSGKFKDVPSISRPLSEEEKTYLKETVDEMYGQFLSAVIDSRSTALKRGYMRAHDIAEQDMQDSEVDAAVADEELREWMKSDVADGRIFTGIAAVETGLIDSIGSFNDAVTRAASLAGLTDYTLKEMKREPTLADIFSGRAESFARNLTSGLTPGLHFQYRCWF